MCRDESGVLTRSSYRENVRWRLALVAEDVRNRIQHGIGEGRRTNAAAARPGGAAVRPSLHRQRGLPARHCDCARLRL